MASTPEKEADPTIARKRRMEILASTRKRVKEETHEDNEDDEDHYDENSTHMKDIHNIKPRTKYQNRYEPEVPMTKEQAAEWRREARRKRNRESAAASRNKIRNRINELEDEVLDWKDRYSTLMQRISHLEERHIQGHPMNQESAPIPLQPAQGSDGADFNQYVSPCTTPASSIHPALALDVDLNASIDDLPFHLSMPSFESNAQDQDSNLATARVPTQEHDTNIHVDAHIPHTNTANTDTVHVPTTPLRNATPNEFHLIETRSRPA
jgi:hypothetical protein